MVVARIDRDPHQPGPQASGRTLERLESPKGTEQGVLGRVGGVFAVAQRAIAHVEDLALVHHHQRVERGDVTALSRSEGRLERARVGLHNSMLPIDALRYGNQP